MGTPSDTNNEYIMNNASMVAGDCSLDYSVWHRNLLKLGGAGPVNTVKVKRISSNAEELKQE